ncbi:MAG: DUF739 family protein [Clostridium sp.]|nr:DUF739 family protein [Clostridium sp.]
MEVIRLQYDYSKLTGLIKECYETQERFAEAIGMGRVSLSQRLNNKMEFRQSEIRKIMEVLEIPSAALGIYFYHIVPENR